jgi:uncharacterized protein involved in type VI secretion and phage assembly
LPEINDEVLVGFELGDVHCPYVLGGLWNAIAAQENSEIIRGGQVEKRIICSAPATSSSWTTPAPGITIEDNGNRMALSTQGNADDPGQGDASLKTEGKLTLEARARSRSRESVRSGPGRREGQQARQRGHHRYDGQPKLGRSYRINWRRG